MKNEKLRKVIFIAVIIILLVLIIILARKITIIKNIQNKISQYTSSTNYHATQYEYRGKQLIVYNTYKKSNVTMSTLKYLTEQDIRTLTNYTNGETSHMYIENGESKIAYMNGNNLPSPIEVSDDLNTYSIIDFINASIKSEECNGKQCYKIDNMDEEGNKQSIYYDKNSGLKVRKIIKSNNDESQVISIVIDYFYEFDNVNESDLKEPDVSQYEVR